MNELKPVEFTPFEPSFDDIMSEPEPLPEEVQNGAPLATWCEPLVNIYREKGPCYLWLRYVPGWPDLEIEEYFNDSMGKRPEWLEDEINNSGLSMIVDLPWHHTMEWVMANGLSPGQPFCIEVYPPHWSKVSYEYNEWDCDWYWDIVRIMPKSPQSAASSWERYLAAVRRDEEKLESARERVRLKRLRDPKALYLKWEGYWPHYYDDAPPGGVRVYLCSDHTSEAGRSYLAHEMFSAESDKGDREEALSKLVALAYKEGLVVLSKWERLRVPWRDGILLSEEAFRKLPVRQRM
jgi:hypothetical protein